MPKIWAGSMVVKTLTFLSPLDPPCCGLRKLQTSHIKLGVDKNNKDTFACNHFPVDDFQRAVGKNLADVARLEPPASRLIAREVLLCLVGHLNPEERSTNQLTRAR